jgi:hypothetical protein
VGVQIKNKNDDLLNLDLLYLNFECPQYVLERAYCLYTTINRL